MCVVVVVVVVVVIVCLQLHVLQECEVKSGRHASDGGVALNAVKHLSCEVFCQRDTKRGSLHVSAEM